MTITTANVSKTGYYDAIAGKVHTGARMIMAENIGFIGYYTATWIFIDAIKTSSGSITSDYASRADANGYINDGSGWTRLFAAPRDGYPTYMPQGTWTLRWNGTSDVYVAQEDGKAFTADAGTDAITISSSELADGSGVQLTTTGTLPSPLQTGTTYYVVNKSGSSHQLSSTKGGSAIDITDTGSGVHTAFWFKNKGGSPSYPGYDHTKEYEMFGDVCGSNIWLKIGYDAGTCTKVEMLQPGEVTRFDAGNIVASQFISDMAGVSCIRNLGMFQINDNCGHQNYSDLNDWNYIAWGGSQTGDIFCKVLEELDCDGWVCVPHQFTSAAHTAYAQDLAANLPAGKKLYIEYSNECWNTAPAFKDQYSWVKRYDVTAVDAVLTPSTREFASTAHGLSTGDIIYCYANNTNATQGLAAGAKYNVVRIDANTLRLGVYNDAFDTITGITQANPAVVTSAGHGYSNGDQVRIYGVTGMTEVEDLDFTVANVTTDTYELSGINSSAYGVFSGTAKAIKTGGALNAGDTLIRYKDSSSVYESTDYLGYATYCPTVWALYKAQLGDNMYRVASGHRANAGTTTAMYGVTAFRDNIDYYSISCYWDFGDWYDQGYDDSSTNDATTMHDADGGWTTDELVGEMLVNRTDGSWGTITSNTTNSVTCSGGFTGGSNNYFNSGDLYRINYFANKTTAQLTTYLKDTKCPTILGQQTTHMNIIGHTNFINYEGGNANGRLDSSSYVQPEIDKIKEWYYSSDAQELNNWFPKQLAARGVKLYCDHVAYAQVIDNSTWGRMEHVGDTDCPAYLGMLEFHQNGGAPKP